MKLMAMNSGAVRSTAGSRGFFVKQTDNILVCHGGIEEVDIALMHGIQTPQTINLIFCEYGLEIKAIASGKVILSALAYRDIASVNFAGGVQPSGSMAGVATTAFLGSLVAGSIGALAGAAMGLNNATSGRICYSINYKTGSAEKMESLLISFLPVYKSKIDKLFNDRCPDVFNPSMTSGNSPQQNRDSGVMWKCPKCNNENPNDTYTCKSCGYKLV
jgi:hypothetical protein